MEIGYGGLFGILVLAGDIWAILNIVQSSASNGNKLVWILVVLLIPLLNKRKQRLGDILDMEPDERAQRPRATEQASKPPVREDALHEVLPQPGIRQAAFLLHRQVGEPLAIEFNTVNDEYATAGTCDLLLRDHDGRPVVCDFKTGKYRSPLEWSLQLIAHARAWHWADNQRTEPVCWARPRLIVIHAPQDGTAPALVELDVDQAKRAAALAVQVRDIRKEIK